VAPKLFHLTCSFVFHTGSADNSSLRKYLRRCVRRGL
jgi:hypothetical protein